MRIEIQPDIRQSLRLTRETIQSVEILSYNPDELLAFLREQYERNPLLKIDFLQPDSNSTGASTRGMEAGNANSTPDRHALPFAGRPSQTDHGKGENWRLPAMGSRSEGGSFDVLDVLQHRVTLGEQLQSQLSFLRLSGDIRQLAIQIIGSLEPDGYLRRPVWEIADTLGVTEEAVEQAIAAVQLLEPVGIAARDLCECLMLQLQGRGPLTSEMSALLNNLDLLQRGEVLRLARLCRVDSEGLAGLLAQLRELDPHPGLAFDTQPVQLAMPDILVTEAASGDLIVELNPALLPKVLIDRAYVATLSKGNDSAEAQEYLRDCLRSANSLIRNLHQRARTTLRIATVVVNYQEAYFRKGAVALRPLSQKEVATLVGVHESTVSRAIANKHISCSHGLVAMKYLLPEALAARDGGEDLATTTIRDRIKWIVSMETAAHVLSDDAIVGILANEGIQIARRTVAKYRTILKIPSSADRRRLMRTRALV